MSAACEGFRKLHGCWRAAGELTARQFARVWTGIARACSSCLGQLAQQSEPTLRLFQALAAGEPRRRLLDRDCELVPCAPVSARKGRLGSGGQSHAAAPGLPCGPWRPCWYWLWEWWPAVLSAFARRFRRGAAGALW